MKETLKRTPIPPRPLTPQEQDWVKEILGSNPFWADVDASNTRVVAACDCDDCKAIYLDSGCPQNPRAKGTLGYIGRVEIITTDDFMITITLDQGDGKLDELYFNYVDTSIRGGRKLSQSWIEKSRQVTSMMDYTFPKK